MRTRIRYSRASYFGRIEGSKMAKKTTGRRALWFGLGLVLIGLGGPGCLVVGLISRDTIPALGAALLGFITGMLVGFFAQGAKEWTGSAMTGSVAVLTDAGAQALLRYGA
jgi:hypothetical protein